MQDSDGDAGKRPAGSGRFTESIPEVPPRARTTRRLCAQIGSAMGMRARSVSEVAAARRVSWRDRRHRAFIEHAEARLVEPEPVRVLGIDETRQAASRSRPSRLSQDHAETGLDCSSAPLRSSGPARATIPSRDSTRRFGHRSALTEVEER